MGGDGDPIEKYSPIVFITIGIVIVEACLYLFLDIGDTTSKKIIFLIVVVFNVLLCFFLGWLYDKIHNNRVEKVVQCLPATVDDWKEYDTRTNEEAIQTLRKLVHGFGYSERVIYDREVIWKIQASYNAYLDFIYGENEDKKEWNNILNGCLGLVICSDKEFDNKLKLALERREEKRQNWCRREYDASILETLEATEDTSL